MVEHQPSKLRVAGSSLVSRSLKIQEVPAKGSGNHYPNALAIFEVVAAAFEDRNRVITTKANVAQG